LTFFFSATPSNCGEILHSSYLPNVKSEKITWPEYLGMVKMIEIFGQSAAKPFNILEIKFYMGAVHRLNVGGYKIGR